VRCGRLTEIYWHFRGAFCFHRQGDEASVNFYQTTSGIFFSSARTEVGNGFMAV
jgi:hypothetical protein